HGAENPDILTPGTADAIERLRHHGYLDAASGAILSEAATLLGQVQSLLRLCTDKDFTEENAPRGLTTALARSAGYTDFAALRNRLERLEAEVSGLYNRLIAEPAAAARQRADSEQEL